MNLSDLIATRSPILLDGAMGTQLDLAGLDMGGQTCLFHPDTVVSIHKQYSAAGCDIVTTNTATMNRLYMETHGVGVDVKEVNLAGVKLARSAASAHQYVLGDVCSSGQLLEPYGEYTEEQLYDSFREQAQILADAGVDGFIIETMLDLREALCALRACRDVSVPPSNSRGASIDTHSVKSPLPVLVSFSFQTTANGGRTAMGSEAKEIAVMLTEAGAAAIGANCGDLTPHNIAIILNTMKDNSDLPLIAQPNAGKPGLVNGKTAFDMTPEAFTDGIAQCIAAGATLIGGCCGTTPEHIRCVAQWLKTKEK